MEASREARPERTEGLREPAERGPDEPAERGYRFDDPYWDEAFGTFYDSAMRVCSVYGC